MIDKGEVLTAESAAELLNNQHALESDAAAVILDLNLATLLSRIGTPMHIGSSAAGLMVWRDIDFNVVAPNLSIQDAFATMGVIAAHPRITKVRYLNERDNYNPTGEPRDERDYCVLFYAADRGEEWKIDISIWLNDVPRSELNDLQNIRSKLTPESRLAILWIKDVWNRLPTYRNQVFSMDIYDAVLEHKVQTPGAFDQYLAERGKPTRRT